MRNKVLFFLICILALFLVSQTISPIVEATKTYTVLGDDQEANPGDVLEYTIVINNKGLLAASDVVFEDTPDFNTIYVAGSIMTTPLARTDTFETAINTALTINDPGVLQNDSDADGVGPALVVTSFDAASANGGIVSVINTGGFTFTPVTDFVGADVFAYTLDDGEGNTRETEVTINVIGTSPLANSDGYSTLLNSSLNVGAGVGPPDGLLINDNLGSPLATLTSFGGGSLGGVVTDHTPGSSVTLAGGALTVNDDGSLSLITPSSIGAFTFSYRISNAQSTSDGTVTIEIQSNSAQAVDDGPYETVVGTTLNVGAGAGPPDGLLVNDQRGTPLAILTSFGGGSLGGSAGTFGAGTVVSLAGGNLVVNFDGSFILLSPTDSGSYTFDYRINNASGASDATVTINIGQ